jgi:hypothetical protein
MNKRHIFVRLAYNAEGKQYLDWALENSDNNEFDALAGVYPSSRTWVACDKDGPLVFQTIQQPLMLESIAPRPGATKEQVALAMKELTQNAITQASIGGSGEVYFLASDEGTAAMASNQIFEELPYKVYRCRLKDLGI